MRKRTTILALRCSELGVSMTPSRITKKHWRSEPITPKRPATWRMRFFPKGRWTAPSVVLAEQASRLSGRNSLLILRILAAAYAEAGRFDEARDTAHQALQAADNQGNVVLSDVLRKEIALYEAGRPYHKEPR